MGVRPGVRVSTDDVATVRARRVLVGDELRPATLRIADGPDEVHKRTLARVELRRMESQTAARA